MLGENVGKFLLIVWELMKKEGLNFIEKIEGAFNINLANYPYEVGSFNKIFKKYAFPISYVLLIFSGLIKAWLLSLDINVGIDPTIIFFGFSFLSLIFIENSPPQFLERINNKDILFPFSSIILFLTWYGLTTLWTLSPEYYTKKLICICLLLFLFVFPILCSDGFYNRFIKVFIAFGFFMSSLYFLFLIRYTFQFSDVFFKVIGKDWYLAYGSLIGGVTLALISCRDVIFDNFQRKILIILSLIMLIIFSARGPLLYFTLVVLSYFLLKKRKQLLLFNKKTILILILSLLFMSVVGFVFSDYLEPIVSNRLSRIGLLFNYQEIPNLDLQASLDTIEELQFGVGGSVNYRLIQYYNSILLIFADPLKFFTGWGIGSYGILEDGIDKRNYPHNFILETFVEAGAVGIMFLMLIFVSFYRFCKERKIIDKEPCLLLLLVYSILSFMTSFSVVEMRLSIVLLGIILFLNTDKQSAFIK